jgi:hypothetical protein
MPNRYLEKIECWSSMSAIRDSLDMTSIMVGVILTPIYTIREERWKSGQGPSE